MSNLFQKLAKSDGSEATGPCLILAVFGKHPGWGDHMPGIGVDNETLASIKQSLYVNGIGRQIDSGAWEKLEAEKRLDGFDHTFLWLCGGHAVLGRLMSSKDGKGRTKYPLVLCVDSEPGSTSFLLNTVRPGVESLSNACKSAIAAEQVASHVRVGQEQLSKLAEADAPGIDLEGLQSDRQRFLNHADFGPDRVGLLRVLHEISTSFGLPGDSRLSGRKATATAQSLTIRVPLAADSLDAALLLWSSFLRSILFPTIPLVLFARAQADWLDVIVGEPKPDDFFFLQASRKATPLATEVPYALSPNAKERLNEIESRFVGEGPGGTMIIRKPSSPVPAAMPPPPASVPSPASALAPPSPPPPASTSAPAPSALAKAPPSSGGKKALVVSGVVLLLIVAGVALLYSGKSVNQKAFDDRVASAKSLLNEKKFDEAIHQAEEAAKLRPQDAQVKQILTQATQGRDGAALEERYQTAIKSARAAFIAGDMTNASLLASKALSIKANDADAKALRDQAQTKMTAIAGALTAESSYKTAMTKGREALKSGDYAEAVKEAGIALQVKPNDKDAVQLQDAVKNETDYQVAMRGGRAALNQNNFPSAIDDANKALHLKPNDADAKSLLEKARQSQASAIQTEAHYQSALQEAMRAMERNDFKGASESATKALTFKSNDAKAINLRNEAESKLAALIASTDKENKFQMALKDGQAALASGDYKRGQALANEALAIKSEDPAARQLAAALAKEEGYQIAMTKAREAMAQKVFSHAWKFAEEAMGYKPNDADSRKIYFEARKQLGLENFHTNTIGMEFVWVDGLVGGGCFVGKYDVTREQYKRVIGNLPPGQLGDQPNLPVMNVAFEDASNFCVALGTLDNKRYMLPTLEQWLSIAGLNANEARDSSIWKTLADRGALAHEVTSLKRKPRLASPAPVGSLAAQTNGVYDVLGNVRQWVSDQERVGFSFQSGGIDLSGVLVIPRTNSVPEWLQRETGFRCILSENSSP